MDSFSLYDYVVKGTKKAISEIIIDLKEEKKEVESQEETETSTSEETE